MDTLTVNTLTFNDMIKLEPRLARLKEKAFIVWQSRRWSRTELRRCWYLELKPEMLRLVGFGAAVPALRSYEAYDYCYQHLYSFLNIGKAAS
jgi:hypothetical protein